MCRRSPTTRKVLSSWSAQGFARVFALRRGQAFLGRAILNDLGCGRLGPDMFISSRPSRPHCVVYGNLEHSRGNHSDFPKVYLTSRSWRSSHGGYPLETRLFPLRQPGPAKVKAKSSFPDHLTRNIGRTFFRGGTSPRVEGNEQLNYGRWKFVPRQYPPMVVFLI